MRVFLRVLSLSGGRHEGLPVCIVTVTRRGKAPPADVKSDKSGAAHPCLKRLSHPCSINQAPSVSESSQEGNDSELSDTNGDRNSVVSCVRADWLIAVCPSNLGDLFFITVGRMPQ